MHTVGSGCPSVTIGSGATVTIEAGAIVKFDLSKSLTVNGALMVQGTAGNKVTFTSIRDDTIGGDTNGDGSATTPAPGNWLGVKFVENSDGASLIDHARFRYGGGSRGSAYPNWGAIWFESASPTVQNTNITDSQHFAFRANLQASPTLTNNTLQDNGINGYALDGGNITSNTIWDITDTSYYIRDNILVSLGSTLTVAPDTVVKFNVDRALTVAGGLQVEGTATNPVYFTSYRDDTIGGDTNGDGSATTPAPGNWLGVKFVENSDGASLIDHARFRYGGGSRGSAYPNWGAIWFESASPTVQNTTVRDSQYFGLLTNMASPNLGCNDIYDNGQFGLRNVTPTSHAVVAENQWWGDASGPTHESNPDGAGDAVSDGVDFTPWATRSCLQANPPTASFDALPLSGTAPLVVTFHNLSSGNFTSCNWDYGDGNFGTFCAESHDHVYLNPGTYTVQLTVTGPDGSDSLTRSDYITVSGSPCPTISNWKGEYWNNPDLSGEPTLCRNDEAIDFEWYDGSPDPAIVDEGFSARWTKDMTFDAGEYHFDIFHDDGARFYIDGEPILDNWCDDCRLWERVTKTLSTGSHPLKLEMFENSGWAAAKLVITPADPSLHAHEIQLQSGWNMISSYIEPQNPNMPDVFAACDVVLVKNGDGEVYWPEFGINQIGNWNVVEGYQVYMNVPCTLTLSGTQVAPEATPISLNAGWSLIGYLRDTPIPIDQALASISDVLVIVKNNAGEVYWPEFGVNQIGDMQPGEGYQIYVSAPATLIYPANE